MSRENFSYFLPPYCLLPRHFGLDLVVCDFKSIKPRLKSQVLLRSQTYCQAVKVHWLPVDIGNSEYSRRCYQYENRASALDLDTAYRFLRFHFQLL